MPLNPRLIRAVWIVGIPSYWELLFSPLLTAPLGPLDGDDWYLIVAGVPIQPINADLLINGTIQLTHPGFTGAETAVGYTGGPPFITTADGVGLMPFGPTPIPIL